MDKLNYCLSHRDVPRKELAKQLGLCELTVKRYCNYSREYQLVMAQQTERNKQIVELHNSGTSVYQLANDFNLSRMQIYRILKGGATA